MQGKHGFPDSTSVHHFHPVGLVGNFSVTACACNQELTAVQLKAIAPTASNANIEKYLPHVNSAFKRFGINSCLGKAHFLAQMLHESGSFKYVKELGTGTLNYDPWRGRGLIQITFESNYAAYGTFIGEDVTSSPGAYEKLENVPHSVLSAAWFWNEYKKLNVTAEDDDFMWCTAIVNGAYNGFDDRLSYLNRAIKEFSAESHINKNKDGSYEFSESRIYKNRKFSFAWGLWNDPGSKKEGIKKNRSAAIAGYDRYLALHSEAGKPSDKAWYGIGKDKEVAIYAKERIDQLRSTK